RTIVEIRASRGGSVFIWPKLCFTATRIAAYEPNGFPYEDLFRQHFDTDFHFIHGSSLDPQNIDSLRKWLNGDTIDALFIDGCKTAFYQDFTNHLPLMSPGGIVFMHDITSTAREHWRCIEEDPQYRTARIIDTSESLQAVQRERLG